MRPVDEILTPEWAEFLPKAGSLLEPIYDKILREKSVGMTILPHSSLVFRIFKNMKPSDVKVIWAGQDVYNTPYSQATGYAFECGSYTSPSWRKIAEIYRSHGVFNAKTLEGKDLQHWVDQGVFLFNKALTVRHNQANSHAEVWEPFSTYVISRLVTDFSPKAIVLLGSEVQKSIGKVGAPHAVFKYEHPAFAAYEQRRWKAEDIFKKINQFLLFTHGVEISW